MKRRSLVFAACAFAFTPVMARERRISVDAEAYQIASLLDLSAQIIRTNNEIYAECDKTENPMECKGPYTVDVLQALYDYDQTKESAKKVYRRLNSDAKKKAFLHVIMAADKSIKDPSINVEYYIKVLEMELDNPFEF